MSDKIKKMQRQLTRKKAVELMAATNYSAAIDCFDMCAAEEPEDFRLYVNRSYCAQRLGRLADALTDARTAVQLNHSHISGHYRKGCVYLASKLFRSAEESLRMALKCDPNDASALQKITETRRLFLQELGFGHKEVEEYVSQYESLQELSDALFAGRFTRVTAVDVESQFSSEWSSESVRGVAADDLLNSMSDLSVDSQSIANSEDLLDKEEEEAVRVSPTDLIRFDGKLNGKHESNDDEIRTPKTNPFKKRVSVEPKEDSFIRLSEPLVDVKIPEPVVHIQVSKESPVSEKSVDSPKPFDDLNVEVKKSTTKLVKTRPQIRLSAK